MECATRIFNTNNIQAGKKGLIEKREFPENNNPATEAQINFLKARKYKGDLNKLTKKEAFELIKEMKTKPNQNEDY